MRFEELQSYLTIDAIYSFQMFYRAMFMNEDNKLVSQDDSEDDK